MGNPYLTLVTTPLTQFTPLMTSELPSAIFQFVPHSTFQYMESQFKHISEDGFTAIQIPPISPPGMHNFGGKQGSAYAPRDMMKVSPIIYNGESVEQYLSGNSIEKSEEEGWTALKAFVESAKRYGLRVVADIVFAHTSRDPDVIRNYVKNFGKDFYKWEHSEGASGGARREDGSWDNWDDIIAINHSGPAREEILKYFSNILEKFIRSGISVFRADAAPKISIKFWNELIAGAKVFADKHGYDKPVFYAEALGTSIDDEVSLVRDGGFDGVTTSMRWWNNLKDTWLLDRSSAMYSVRGSGVSFVDNNDTTRAVKFYDENISKIAMHIALTAFMSSSMTVLDGTFTLDPAQPSVFLAKAHRPSQLPNHIISRNPLVIKSLFKYLLELKARFPIFRTSAYTELITDGSPLVRIRRTTYDEQVEIAINTDEQNKATYIVPVNFSYGNIFGMNKWSKDANLWFGKSKGDTPILYYDLAPFGMAVFYRHSPGSLTAFRIP